MVGETLRVLCKTYGKEIYELLQEFYDTQKQYCDVVYDEISTHIDADNSSNHDYIPHAYYASVVPFFLYGKENVLGDVHDITRRGNIKPNTPFLMNFIYYFLPLFNPANTDIYFYIAVHADKRMYREMYKKMCQIYDKHAHILAHGVNRLISKFNALTSTDSKLSAVKIQPGNRNVKIIAYDINVVSPKNKYFHQLINYTGAYLNNITEEVITAIYNESTSNKGVFTNDTSKAKTIDDLPQSSEGFINALTSPTIFSSNIAKIDSIIYRFINTYNNSVHENEYRYVINASNLFADNDIVEQVYDTIIRKIAHRSSNLGLDRCITSLDDAKDMLSKIYNNTSASVDESTAAFNWAITPKDKCSHVLPMFLLDELKQTTTQDSNTLHIMANVENILENFRKSAVILPLNNNNVITTINDIPEIIKIQGEIEKYAYDIKDKFFKSLAGKDTPVYMLTPVNGFTRYAKSPKYIVLVVNDKKTIDKLQSNYTNLVNVAKRAKKTIVVYTPDLKFPDVIVTPTDIEDFYKTIISQTNCKIKDITTAKRVKLQNPNSEFTNDDNTNIGIFQLGKGLSKEEILKRFPNANPAITRTSIYEVDYANKAVFEPIVNDLQNIIMSSYNIIKETYNTSAKQQVLKDIIFNELSLGFKEIAEMYSDKPELADLRRKNQLLIFHGGKNKNLLFTIKIGWDQLINHYDNMNKKPGVISNSNVDIVNGCVNIKLNLFDIFLPCVNDANSSYKPWSMASAKKGNNKWSQRIKNKEIAIHIPI